MCVLKAAPLVLLVTKFTCVLSVPLAVAFSCYSKGVKLGIFLFQCLNKSFECFSSTAAKNKLTSLLKRDTVLSGCSPGNVEYYTVKNKQATYYLAVCAVTVGHQFVLLIYILICGRLISACSWSEF